MYKRNDMVVVIAFGSTILVSSLVSFAGILCEYIHHTNTVLRVAWLLSLISQIILIPCYKNWAKKTLFGDSEVIADLMVDMIKQNKWWQWISTTQMISFLAFFLFSLYHFTNTLARVDCIVSALAVLLMIRYMRKW